MKKYLISGVKDSNSGVGRLLKNLVFYAEKYKFKCLYRPRKKKNARLLLIRNKDFIGLLKELLLRSTYLIRLLIFVIHISFLRNKKIIIIHPQSLGFNLFFRLLDHNDVSIYVVDNSFFCIKSNNFRHPIGECLDCLGNVNNCHESCQPSPIRYDKLENLNYLRRYKEYSPEINFFAQNYSQSVLLMKHFEEFKSIEIIGMNTGEIKLYKNERSNVIYCEKEQDNIWPDIVYHGVASYAKGIEYILKLARELKNYTFLIPEDQKTVENYLGSHIAINNIVFEKCTWETGLKEYVIKSKLTICPSLWSAPIEGALIKSMVYSPMTAAVSTQYGFVNDIPEDLILKLDSDPKQASISIIKYLKDVPFVKNKQTKTYLNILLNESEAKMKLLFQ